MSMRRKARWFGAAAVVFAVVVGAYVHGAFSSPPFRVGSTTQDVEDCLAAQRKRERHLPPFQRDCGAVLHGEGSNVWVLGTEFCLREDDGFGHGFANRRLPLVFSTNGILTRINSRWEWTIRNAFSR